MAIEKRISRREMLRNAAIAGGVAWAAPMLVASLPARASVSTNLCTGLGDECIGNFNPCSTCGPLGGYCFDTNGHDHRPFCGENDYCQNLEMCTAGTCPKGYKCSYHNGCTGCEGTSGVCVKVCHEARPSGVRKAVRTGGRTLAGIDR
jgi:hypothetical protein